MTLRPDVRLPHSDQVIAAPNGRPAPWAETDFTALARMVRRARSGDRDAQTSLVVSYSARVRAKVCSIIGNSHETDDLVQMTFIKAFNGLGRLRELRLFEAWLFRLAHNICLDHFRRSRSRPVASGSEQQLLDLADERRPGALAEIVELLEGALDCLNPRDQLVMRMVIEGNDYDMIARASGSSTSAVKVRVCRLRAFMRTAIGAEAGSRMTPNKLASLTPLVRFKRVRRQGAFSGARGWQPREAARRDRDE